MTGSAAPAPLESCCSVEAKRSLRAHRDVAVCDGCGRLLLAYGVNEDFQQALAALREQGMTPRVGRSGALQVVAKTRASRGGARTRNQGEQGQG